MVTCYTSSGLRNSQRDLKLAESSQPAKMPTSGENMKSSLRTILADSHVSAVAIAVLLFWSLDYAFWALWNPVSRAVSFSFTGVAILGIPYFSPTLTLFDRLTLFVVSFSYLLSSLVCLTAAGLLSRWVYGVGPLCSLSKYRSKLARCNHV